MTTMSSGATYCRYCKRKATSLEVSFSIVTLMHILLDHKHIARQQPPGLACIDIQDLCIHTRNTCQQQAWER